MVLVFLFVLLCFLIHMLLLSFLIMKKSFFILEVKNNEARFWKALYEIQ